MVTALYAASVLAAAVIAYALEGFIAYIKSRDV